MPKRRSSLPTGLASIGRSELAWWRLRGPSIGEDEQLSDDGRVIAHAWPDVGTWAAFYGSIRDEMIAMHDRPHLHARSVAEAMFHAWEAGEDPEAVREALLEEQRANDPRHLLRG